MIHVSLSLCRGIVAGLDHLGWDHRLSFDPHGTDNGRAAGESLRPFGCSRGWIQLRFLAARFFLAAVFFFGAAFLAFFALVTAAFLAARLRLAFLAGIGLSGA